jgi:hypothetical protein
MMDIKENKNNRKKKNKNPRCGIRTEIPSREKRPCYQYHQGRYSVVCSL